MFLTERVEDTLLPRLRVKRRAKASWTPKLRYRTLAVFAVVLHEWTETIGSENGWRTLEAYGLTKDVLRELWDDEEADVQQLDELGEWKDVYQIEYPNKPPREVD